MHMRGTRLAISASLLTVSFALAAPAFAQEAAQDKAAEAPVDAREIVVTEIGRAHV